MLNEEKNIEDEKARLLKLISKQREDRALAKSSSNMKKKSKTMDQDQSLRSALKDLKPKAAKKLYVSENFIDLKSDTHYFEAKVQCHFDFIMNTFCKFLSHIANSPLE